MMPELLEAPCQPNSILRSAPASPNLQKQNKMAACLVHSGREGKRLQSSKEICRQPLTPFLSLSLLSMAREYLSVSQNILEF